MSRRFSNRTAILFAVIFAVVAFTFKMQRQAGVAGGLLDDRGRLLDRKQEERVGVYLQHVKKKYGIDYRIILLKELQEPVLDWTVRRFSELKVGEKFGGKGLLLVVSQKPSVARVEVGYALEPYLTDIEASGIVNDYLKMYYQSGELHAAIEVSVEMLINEIRDKMGDVKKSQPIQGSGGAGGNADLVAKIPEVLDVAGLARLEALMVPQKTPEEAYDLELAMLSKGIHRYDLELFDSAWRKREGTRRWSPEALRRSARTFDRPYKTLIKGKYALIYYPGHGECMPTFLERTERGWIIDRSQTAKVIHYNLDSTAWFAYEGTYPQLELLLEVFKMKKVRLADGQRAYEVVE